MAARLFRGRPSAYEQVAEIRSNMIPYREDGVTKYISASAMEQISPLESSTWDDTTSMRTLVPGPLDEDSIQRFTATGRPMPKFKQSSWSNCSADGMAIPPQLLPQRYTDESIIPVVVTDFIPRDLPEAPRRNSMFGMLKSGKQKMTAKVWFMPRGTYLKHFAKDEVGEYKGTEPQRIWTEEELDAEFKHNDIGRRYSK